MIHLNLNNLLEKSGYYQNLVMVQFELFYYLMARLPHLTPFLQAGREACALISLPTCRQAFKARACEGKF